MSWFGVRVFRRATHSKSSPSDDLFEESVFLVEATDERAATDRATEFAGQLNTKYENVYGEIVTWRLERVFDPCEIDGDQPSNGTEVYSRFYYVRDGREVSPREMPD